MRSSPRASIGLSMLPASIAPSAAPAPTTVCSSSMKVMTSPSASVISLRTALSRSSNSPRYLAPATMRAQVEADRAACCFRLSGTSPSTMRRASPSTMAVLPTPGSPMSTGLFLVRRDSTWMTRRISSSRPMTGSILPGAGRLGEVAAVLLERLVLLLGVLAGDPVAAPHLLRGRRAARSRVDARGGRPAPAAGARWRGTRRAARPRSASASLEHVAELATEAGLAAVGLGQLGDGLVGRVAHAAAAPSPSLLAGSGRTTPSSWPSRAASRWSGVTSGLFCALAASTALNASWVFRVQRFGSSAMAASTATIKT